MDPASLLYEVEQLIAAATSGGGLSYPQKKRVEVLTHEILNAEVRKCNCSDRWLDALFLCRKNLKNRRIMKKEICNYRLKDGVVLQFQNGVYTNANLTDKVATAYLAKYPNTKYFAEKRPAIAPAKAEKIEAAKRSENDDLSEMVEAIQTAIDNGVSLTKIREGMKTFVFSNGDTASTRAINEAIKQAKGLDEDEHSEVTQESE